MVCKKSFRPILSFLATGSDSAIVVGRLCNGPCFIRQFSLLVVRYALLVAERLSDRMNRGKCWMRHAVQA